MNCPWCNGTQWVCEDHRYKPEGHDDCGGAGAPCPVCNPRADDRPRSDNVIDLLARSAGAKRGHK